MYNAGASDLFKICATCSFWRGDRMVLENDVQYDGNEEGACSNFLSTCYATDTNGTSYCSAYESIFEETEKSGYNFCGYCKYWQGERTVSMGTVDYNMYDYGKCNNYKSACYNQDVQASSSCHLIKFVKGIF